MPLHHRISLEKSANMALSPSSQGSETIFPPPAQIFEAMTAPDYSPILVQLEFSMPLQGPNDIELPGKQDPNDMPSWDARWEDWKKTQVPLSAEIFAEIQRYISERLGRSNVEATMEPLRVWKAEQVPLEKKDWSIFRADKVTSNNRCWIGHRKILRQLPPFRFTVTGMVFRSPIFDLMQVTPRKEIEAIWETTKPLQVPDRRCWIDCRTRVYCSIDGQQEFPLDIAKRLAFAAQFFHHAIFMITNIRKYTEPFRKPIKESPSESSDSEDQEEAQQKEDGQQQEEDGQQQEEDGQQEEEKHADEATRSRRETNMAENQEEAQREEDGQHKEEKQADEAIRSRRETSMAVVWERIKSANTAADLDSLVRVQRRSHWTFRRMSSGAVQFWQPPAAREPEEALAWARFAYRFLESARRIDPSRLDDAQQGKISFATALNLNCPFDEEAQKRREAHWRLPTIESPGFAEDGDSITSARQDFERCCFQDLKKFVGDDELVQNLEAVRTTIHDELHSALNEPETPWFIWSEEDRAEEVARTTRPSSSRQGTVPSC